MREEFTKAVKLAAWQRANGQCENCTQKLFPGNIEFHHQKECTFGGTNGLKNCVVLCRACHSNVTRKQAAVVAKSNRVRNAHIGIKRKKRKMPYRKFDGTPVWS